MRRIIFLLLILVGCTIPNTPHGQIVDGKPVPIENQEPPAWLDTELTDVRTGDTFKISDFEKPVLLESFAVWCPTCTRQQNKIKELHDDAGDDIISISLDTDPNEDREKILNHITSNGFSWRYAISPKSLTQSLIDQFGIRIVNAPSIPMLLICPDLSMKMLKSGVKSPDFLKSEATGCSGG